MTIPGLIIINLLVGATVSFGAKVQIRNLQRPVFYNRYFSALILMELFIFLPIGLYYSGFYPDWSWMYLLDTRSLPEGVNVMTLLAYPVATTMGYLVGYFSARSNSNWVAVMFMVFLISALVGLFVVGADKLANLGTFEQYHNNIGLHPWTSTSLLPSVIITWIGVSICWGYLLYRFWKEGHLTMAATRS